MVEKIAFMHVEDNMVAFERENGNPIFYPIVLVPMPYKEGDIIDVIVHGAEFIEFIEIDKDEMERRHARIKKKKTSLRERARRSTNKK